MTDRTKDDGMTAEQMAPSALDLARKILADGVRDKVSLDTETGGDAVTVYIGRWMHLDAAGALALAKALTTLQQDKAALEREREKLAAQLEMERTYRWDYEATIQRLREALEWCAQAVLDISNAPTDGRYVPRRTELRDAAVGIFTRANAALAATPTEDR
jgi:hypothetical protein